MKLMKFANNNNTDNDTRDAVRRATIASGLTWIPVGSPNVRFALNRAYGAAEGQTTDNKHSAVGALIGPTGVSGARAKDTGHSTELATVATSGLLGAGLSAAAPFMRSDKNMKKDLKRYVEDGEKGMRALGHLYGEKTKERFSEFKKYPELGKVIVDKLSPEELKEIRKGGLVSRSFGGLLSGALFGGLGYGLGKSLGSNNKKDN